MDRSESAASLSDLLALDHPPVGLSFVTQAPDGMAVAEHAVPSSCTFWREAERGVFYAPAAQHFNCPVGAMVMGFTLPEDVTTQLGGFVQSMCDAQYLEMAEAEKIPSVGSNAAGIVYGPLGDVPGEPDLVLLWLTPGQAMIFNEAAGTASWTEAPMEVSGRPGCTALALAAKNDQPRLSLGCAGMRVFTEIPDDRVLAVLPGSGVTGFVAALQGVVESNSRMRTFYAGHKAAISG
jgi:uncharacterized protein (DUF169 family)